jgi:hypothetical protein
VRARWIAALTAITVSALGEQRAGPDAGTLLFMGLQLDAEALARSRRGAIQGRDSCYGRCTTRADDPPNWLNFCRLCFDVPLESRAAKPKTDCQGI